MGGIFTHYTFTRSYTILSRQKYTEKLFDNKSISKEHDDDDEVVPHYMLVMQQQYYVRFKQFSTIQRTSVQEL